MRFSLVHITLLLLALAAVPGANSVFAQAQKSGIRLHGPPTVRFDMTPDATGTATSENAETRLMWNRPKTRSKITVSTVSPGQSHRLTVEAEDVKSGIATGAVQLVDGMPDTNLIVNLDDKSAGMARIRYIASTGGDQDKPASASSDSHTVIYTITDQ